VRSTRSGKRDPDAPRTRPVAPPRRAVTRRAAESCASQAPTEDPTGIGVIAPEPRADKARAARDGSPPDRFLRTPGFGGSTWRTADAAQAEAPEALCDGRLGDGLDNGMDDRRRARTPPCDRESADRAGVGGTHAPPFHRRSMQAVAMAQAREVNTRSRRSRVDPTPRTPSSLASMAPLSRSAGTFKRYVTSSSGVSEEIAAQPTFTLGSAQVWDDCCEDMPVSALWPCMLVLGGMAFPLLFVLGVLVFGRGDQGVF